MKAKELFEKLGYSETISNYCIYHQNKNKEINIWLKAKTIECFEYMNEDEKFIPIDITLEELQAINQQCRELGWLDER